MSDIIDTDNPTECGRPPDAVAALTLWGEARGEGLIGIKAVASVIHRRAVMRRILKGMAFDLAVSDVCLTPHQFSCWDGDRFVQSDPEDSQAWEDCDEVARQLVSGDFEPTIIATHYYAQSMVSPPYWTASMEFVGRIGRHLFYRKW
jgi:spore germination cell wall hydrolase CwlJ-like protein